MLNLVFIYHLVIEGLYILLNYNEFGLFISQFFIALQTLLKYV